MNEKTSFIGPSVSRHRDEGSFQTQIMQTAKNVACPFRRDSLPGQIPFNGSTCEATGANIDFSSEGNGGGKRVIILQRPDNCPIKLYTTLNCEATPGNAREIVRNNAELRRDVRPIQ